jgi:hypothetical protein
MHQPSRERIARHIGHRTARSAFDHQNVYPASRCHWTKGDHAGLDAQANAIGPVSEKRPSCQGVKR